MKWEVIVSKWQLTRVIVEAPTGREAMKLTSHKFREMLQDDTLWGQPHCELVSADLASMEASKD
jgi:hypothetical protein